MPPKDPLRTSLEEQLLRLRGSGPLPPALTDIVREQIAAGGFLVDVLRPSDWDQLRHEEGAEGRTAPYWARPWPSGVALADAIAGRDFEGRRVLELGCGLAIPSIVAARRGATVVATDGNPDAVAFAAHNLAINDAPGNVALADWREADELAAGGPWDLVLAADVLYVRHNVEALLRVLPRLIGEHGTAIVADPSRAGGRDFVASAKRIFALETRSDPQRERVQLHTLTPAHRRR